MNKNGKKWKKTLAHPQYLGFLYIFCFWKKKFDGEPTLLLKILSNKIYI